MITSQDTAEPINPRQPLLVPPFNYRELPLTLDEGLDLNQLPPLNQLGQEVALTEGGALVKRIIEYGGLIADLLESFDLFVTTRISQVLLNNPLKLRVAQGLSYVFARNVVVVPPTYNSENKSYPLYPNRARESGSNYMASLFVDFVQVVQTEQGYQQLAEVKNVHLGDFPAMLRSRACHLYGKTDREVVEMGECVNDPGGYFIIGGTEYYLDLQRKLRLNRPLIYHTVSGGNPKCTMTCNTYQGTKVVNVRAPRESRTIKVEMVVSNRFAGYNLYEIYRLYGFDQDYTDAMIAQFLEPRRQAKALLMLARTKDKSNTHPDLTKYFNSKIRGDSQSDLTLDNISLLVREALFPHMNPTAEEQVTQADLDEILVNKLQLLASMIARFIDHLAGADNLDSRDNWANQIMENAGRLFEKKFTKIWSDISDAVSRNITTKTTLESLTQTINKNLMRDSFAKDFKSSEEAEWGNAFSDKDAKAAKRLHRKSVVQLVGSLTRLTANTSDKGKQFKLRDVQLSQTAYVCPFDTTEGAKCGIVTAKTVACRISQERPDKEVMILLGLLQQEYQQTHGTQTVIVNQQAVEQPVKLVMTIYRSDETGHVNPLLVNGKFKGWVRGEELRQELVRLRRTGYLYFDAAIVMFREALYVHTDASRPTAPFWVVENGVVLAEQALKAGQINLMTPFKELLEAGYVEYLDAFEAEQPHILVAQTATMLAEHQLTLTRLQENLAQLEQAVTDPQQLERARQAYQRASLNYSHCLDPASLLGASASIIPLINNNPGTRITYQCNMGKQSAGIYHSNFNSRMDNQVRVLTYPTPPIMMTTVSRLMGLSDLPAGQNVILAIATMGGYTQEDSIIMNKTSRDRGLFRMSYYLTFSETLPAKPNAEFTKPALDRKLQPGALDPYRNLTEQGTPMLGSYLKAGDCVIGKVRYTTVNGIRESRNESIFIKSGEEGFVERAVVSRYEGGTTIKVKIRQTRKPIAGDKFSSRYAQKSTVSVLLNQEDMPFTREGLVPDIIINPHAIPSRMTIGKLMEIVASKAGALTGRLVDATFGRDFNLATFLEVLRQYGYQPQGKEVMYSGTTGQRLEATIFIGPCYYQALHHQVRDKVQARGRGALSVSQRAPPKGKKKGGGIRFGEMEKDAYVGHGSAAFLKGRLCTDSDAYVSVYCLRCGAMAIHEQETGIVNCRRCAGSRGQTCCPSVTPSRGPLPTSYYQSGGDTVYQSATSTIREFGSRQDYGNFGKRELPWSWNMLIYLLAGFNVTVSQKLAPFSEVRPTLDLDLANRVNQGFRLAQDDIREIREILALPQDDPRRQEFLQQINTTETDLVRRLNQ